MVYTDYDDYITKKTPDRLFNPRYNQIVGWAAFPQSTRDKCAAMGQGSCLGDVKDELKIIAAFAGSDFDEINRRPPDVGE